LQIASKEFLNALVRRFPERPPARYAPNPVQSAPENQWNHFDYVPPQQFMANPVIDRILYLIKEWKVALTELSRYREDMHHIRDMYRLLKFKGWLISTFFFEQVLIWLLQVISFQNFGILQLPL
jgi:hypothetical protein